MPGSIIKYQKRLSGPLLDRIDLHIDVPPVKEDELGSNLKSESSKSIHNRIMKARNKQYKRFYNCKIKTNGEMNTKEIKKYCTLEPDALLLLKKAVSHLSISARSYFKIIKIAQTISDLENTDIIKTAHIAESLQYRAKEISNSI